MKHKKPKRSTKKKSKEPKTNKDPSASSKNPSIDELIDAGYAAVAAMEPDKALALLSSAETLLRKNTQQETPALEKLVQVLEKLGEIKATLGDTEAAKQDFQNAISLLHGHDVASPSGVQTASHQETLAGLHLYLGQLSAEQEALDACKKGLEYLEKAMELREQECKDLPQDSMEIETDTDNQADKESPRAMLQEVRKKLASARVTVAELYLTDLCYEENAETECESYVNLALKMVDEDGEPMIDALQTAANLRLSQKRNVEARQYILRAYNKIRTGCEALANLVGLDDEKKKSKRSVELEEVDAADSLPTLEFRCQTAKLLLECAVPTSQNDDGDGDKPPPEASLKRPAGAEEEQEQTKCYKASIYVLGSLLAENDEIPEVWYLLGCAYKGLDNTELAGHYWAQALEMLTNIQKEAEETTDMNDDEDENDESEMQLQSISCQMEEIKSKLEDLEEDKKRSELMED